MAEPAAPRGPAIRGALIPEFAAVPLDRTSFRVAVSLSASDVLEAARTRLHMVLDVSGSMTGESMAVTKDVAEFVVDHMKGSDNVGITTYANHAETPLPLQAMTYVAKERARKVIAEIEAGGATAFYDGLEAGLQEMEGAAPGDVTADAVLLMTDGHPSHGPKTLPDITQRLDARRAAGKLVPVHCFGLGADHDAELLLGVADACDGCYNYLPSQKDIRFAFADMLGGVLSCVARDITVTLQPLGGNCRLTAVQAGGRPVGEVADDGGRAFAFADLFGGERRELLVSLELSEPEDVYEDEWGEDILAMDLAYTDLATGNRVNDRCVLHIPRQTAIRTTDGLTAHPDVIVAAARFDTATALEAAMAQHRQGSSQLALATLSTASADLKAAQAALLHALAAKLYTTALEAPDALRLQTTVAVLVAEIEDALGEVQSGDLPAVKWRSAVRALIQQRAMWSSVASKVFELFDTVWRGKTRKAMEARQISRLAERKFRRPPPPPPRMPVPARPFFPEGVRWDGKSKKFVQSRSKAAKPQPAAASAGSGGRTQQGSASAA